MQHCQAPNNPCWNTNSTYFEGRNTQKLSLWNWKYENNILELTLPSYALDKALGRHGSLLKSHQIEKTIIDAVLVNVQEANMTKNYFQKLHSEQPSILMSGVGLMVRVVGGLGILGSWVQIPLGCWIHTRWGWLCLSSFRGRKNECQIAGILCWSSGLCPITKETA